MARVVRSWGDLVDKDVVVFCHKHLNGKHTSSPELLDHTDSNILRTLGYLIRALKLSELAHGSFDILIVGDLEVASAVTKGLPRRVDNNLVLLGQLLENSSLDMFGLNTQNAAVIGQLPDLLRILEGSIDMVLASADLLSRGIGGVKDGDFDLER
ncbi:hypothetical protein HG530_007796 [Fusarium avenaceum]|nr:hypothetical protein HG530_007796 [Fusarium avenaceum]